MVKDSRIVGLILAAGYSSRMGAFKPLLPIGDKTAMERVSASLKAAGIKDMIGVTGYQRELLSPVLAEEGVTEAYNPDFAQGMFTSIRTGIRRSLEGEAAVPDGYFLMLVDCPLVPSGVMKQLLAKHREEPEAFIVPCFRGKKGHPLFIPGQYAEEILAYEGEGGLKAITKRHEDKLIRLDVETEAVVLDMDTPESYKEILAYYARQMEIAGRPGAVKAGMDDSEASALETELEGKRLFLIRHGQIMQHQEKIFIGQTDIPLSEKGREQAQSAAEELIRHGVSASRIYASDLSRALETAEIIGDRLGGTVISVPKLREMSLGEWDGKYISEIRERYPEEYRKRGEDLTTYKFGNESENFYDLRYRVLKGLLSILKMERKAGVLCRDIVVVSHSGVINVIISELEHRKLQEQIRNHIPNGGMVLMNYTITKEMRL